MDARTPTKWQNDPVGRIRNLSLAPSPKNALLPLLEAVMNSIHAIEDRFGKDDISRGHVDIEVVRADDDSVGFRIRDNGIGFTPENIDSFERMDSQTKAAIGGKGVGRLVWLKVLDEAYVRSTYHEAGGIKSVSFAFCVDDPTRDIEIKDAGHGDIGTVIDLHPYRSEYATQIPKKAATVANRILAHFISYFINISHPRITVYDGAEQIDLFDQFTGATERDQDFKFEIELDGGQAAFALHCFLLPKAISDDERSTNALYLGANGRAVKRYDMDPVIGLKAIDGKFAFLGYVESTTLDEAVNDTRTDFSLSDDDIDAIVDQAKEHVREFLSPELSQIRAKQAETITQLRNEHPRFLSVARDAQQVSETLHLATQKKEDIYVELSRKSLRSYEKRKNGFRRSVSKKLPDIEAKAKEFVSGLKDESISSLAEYVAKRKLILDVFEQSLRFKKIETEESEYENVLHEIICPLKSTSDDLNYDDHNLWIVDDRLAFYSYFNSDVQMRAQIKDPENPLDRPDLSIFDIGLGFKNPDASNPITILEFKRPKIDNYTLEKNPITQVRKYVEDMRKAGEATKYDGTPIRTIDEKTPFMCHIIADITPKLRSVMRDLGPFHQRAGTSSFYCWDDSYSIFIEISSFKDILESAKSRNRIFFEHIGLA